jgi:hypothetical protein
MTDPVQWDDKVGEVAQAHRDRMRSLGQIAALLERNGVSIDDVGRVRKVNLWQAAKGNEDGGWDVQDLVGVQLSPAWEDGPKWPVVQPAKPCRPRPAGPRPAPATDGPRTAVILPDPQIGYRMVEGGVLEPFHDEAAIAVALAITKSLRPDKIVNLGDTLDLPEHGKYRKEPSFVGTTQPTLDRAHEFLAQQRECSREDSEIDLIEGNHDRRLANYVLDNALAAFGIRQANLPASWPVLSVPNLLRLDELGVTYIEGYPAGISWINDRLGCVHGENLNPDKTLNEEQVSIAHGHLHRVFRKSRTRRLRNGKETITVFSPGCLCRIDGAVPSMRGSTDSKGAPIHRVHDWQQGIAVVTYYPGDGPFWVELVDIEDGRAMFRGKEFRAS